ncbi:signal peptidase II [Lactobacillus colini]|uniref:Lipoprotein signal peptidase n=1 Tax=Lactobacillus colini TaxID=1819254 RepID=A0ABS4MEB5_9LACO|nr:signal peptidase II [Lactobacillus colini]MBP2058025.1 signal peptidase II [Lactobacillus colini]
MKKITQSFYLFISLIVVILDQWLKYYIHTNFEVGQIKNVIPGLLSFNYLRNNGAAWNIFSGQMWLFYIITLVAVIVVLYYLFNPKYKNKVFDIGLALVLGGIIGNFIDRIHLHYVIDMFQLDFVNFNIFNIADSAITIGIVLVFIYLIFFEDKKDTTA